MDSSILFKSLQLSTAQCLGCLPILHYSTSAQEVELGCLSKTKPPPISLAFLLSSKAWSIDLTTDGHGKPCSSLSSLLLEQLVARPRGEEVGGQWAFQLKSFSRALDATRGLAVATITRMRPSTTVGGPFGLEALCVPAAWTRSQCTLRTQVGQA